MKKCAFCDQPLGRTSSSEHIFPQWLLGDLEIPETDVSPTHFAADGSKVSTRSHDLGSLVAGRICETCNSGWMSDLESDAKPHLSKSFSNKLSVAKCAADHKLLIARWAFKTALTLNLGSNFLKSIPMSHYHHICNDATTLPENTIVVGQNHHFNRDFCWIQSATWMVDDASDKFDEAIQQKLKSESYKIGFQIRGLLLVVAYNPLNDFLFSLWRGMHVPLYPASGSVVWHNKSEFPWRDSEKALYNLHAGLELHRPA